MNFEQYIECAEKYREECVAKNSRNIYKSVLNVYERVLLSIPGAPQPYPITVQTIMAILHIRRKNNTPLLH